MSDAKWRKFFKVSALHVDRVPTGVWKLVNEEESVEAPLPSPHDVLETVVDGCLNGPIAYKAIEWLRIPRTVLFRRYANAPLSSRVQDVEALSFALSEEGQFPIESTSEGILLRAYLRGA